MINQSQIDSMNFDDQKSAFVLLGKASSYLTLLKHLDLTPVSQEMLFHVLNCVYTYESDIITSDDLTFIPLDLVERSLAGAGKKLSKSTRSSRLKNLVTSGILEEFTTQLVSSKRTKKIFALKSLVELNQLADKLRDKSTIDDSVTAKGTTSRKLHHNELQRLKQMKVATSFGQELATIDVSVTDRRFSLIAGTFKTSPQQKTSLIKGELLAGHKKFQIQSSASEGFDLACQDDLSTINAICTICEIAIAEIRTLGGEVENNFLIDLNDICILKNLNPSGGNRISQARSMQRLRGTITQIYLDDSEEADNLRRLLMLDKGQYHDISFLTGMSAHLEYSEQEEETSPRWIRISIDNVTYKFLSKQVVADTTPIILAHPELMKMGSETGAGVGTGTIYMLYQFLNIEIKRRGNIQKTFTLDEMHKRIAAQSDFKTFRQQITNAAKAIFNRTDKIGRPTVWMENGANNAALLGYVMIWNTQDGFVREATFNRDIRDHITGNSSRHNALLKSEAKNKSKQHGQQELWLGDTPPDHLLDTDY